MPTDLRVTPVSPVQWEGTISSTTAANPFGADFWSGNRGVGWLALLELVILVAVLLRVLSRRAGPRGLFRGFGHQVAATGRAFAAPFAAWRRDRRGVAVLTRHLGAPETFERATRALGAARAAGARPWAVVLTGERVAVRLAAVRAPEVADPWVVDPDDALVWTAAVADLGVPEPPGAVPLPIVVGLIGADVVLLDAAAVGPVLTVTGDRAGTDLGHALTAQLVRRLPAGAVGIAHGVHPRFPGRSPAELAADPAVRVLVCAEPAPDAAGEPAAFAARPGRTVLVLGEVRGRRLSLRPDAFGVLPAADGLGPVETAGLARAVARVIRSGRPTGPTVNPPSVTTPATDTARPVPGATGGTGSGRAGVPDAAPARVGAGASSRNGTDVGGGAALDRADGAMATIGLEGGGTAGASGAGRRRERTGGGPAAAGSAGGTSLGADGGPVEGAAPVVESVGGGSGSAGRVGDGRVSTRAASGGAASAAASASTPAGPSDPADAGASTSASASASGSASAAADAGVPSRPRPRVSPSTAGQRRPDADLRSEGVDGTASPAHPIPAASQRPTASASAESPTTPPTPTRPPAATAAHRRPPAFASARQAHQPTEPPTPTAEPKPPTTPPAPPGSEPPTGRSATGEPQPPATPTTTAAPEPPAGRSATGGPQPPTAPTATAGSKPPATPPTTPESKPPAGPSATGGPQPPTAPTATAGFEPPATPTATTGSEPTGPSAAGGPQPPATGTAAAGSESPASPTATATSRPPTATGGPEPLAAPPATTAPQPPATPTATGASEPPATSTAATASEASAVSDVFGPVEPPVPPITPARL
ncbi:hypothetical protein [Embleya scabrispora]|uniref:hypothetical protein n=1 Tax=Embleya scabrispora TaxID=159449 RepID=UPI00118065BD|nr:hypothetical protein [Embleya scabrispora]